MQHCIKFLLILQVFFCQEYHKAHVSGSSEAETRLHGALLLEIPFYLFKKYVAIKVPAGNASSSNTDIQKTLINQGCSPFFLHISSAIDASVIAAHT